MTLAGLKFARKPTLHLRSTPFQCVPKFVLRSLAAAEAEAPTNEQSSVSIREEEENEKAPAWKRLNHAEIGIRNSMIGSTTKKVLNGLKQKGIHPDSIICKSIQHVRLCEKEYIGKKFLSKQSRKIDYEFLAPGNLQEVRHVFARIVLDTVYPGRLV